MSASHASQPSRKRSFSEISTQQPAHKASLLSRLAGYVGLGSAARAHSPTATTTTTTLPEQVVERSEPRKPRAEPCNETAHGSSTGTPRPDYLHREWYYFAEPDRFWHSPSIHDMLEAVYSAIKTSGTSEPIPRKLNPYVMDIIEEFRNQEKRLRSVTARLDDQHNARQLNHQEFQMEKDEWNKSERNYQAEILRLKHIISHATESASSVALAQAGSVAGPHDAEESHDKMLDHKSVASAENVGDVRVTKLSEAPGPQSSPASSSSNVSRCTSTKSSAVSPTQYMITPRTPKISSGANALAAIRKWREVNGSLPEDAIGDEGYSTASSQPPATEWQPDHFHAQQTQLSKQDGREKQIARKAPGSMSSPSSPTLASMGYNHVTGIHIDDGKATRNGWQPKNNRPHMPSRIAQGDFFIKPSQGAIDAAHQGVTTIAKHGTETRRCPVGPGETRPLPQESPASRPLQRQPEYGTGPISGTPTAPIGIQNPRSRKPLPLTMDALL